jgi:NAD(P)H-hydrate epimerase
LKIFSTAQIRAWDQHTITETPIDSVALMNRAAKAFADWFIGLYPDTKRPVCVFAGAGNNGGDGLAVARLLHQAFYTAKVFVCDFNLKHSGDFDAQWGVLPEAIERIVIQPGSGDFSVPADAVVIDALFGSGLSRPLTGAWAGLIKHLNSLPNERVAIDLPSGLFADIHTDGPIIRADRTFSFETPKLAFLFPENGQWVGQWGYGSIGLLPDFAAREATPYHYTTRTEAAAIIQPRATFSHKGTYGHALILAGSYGKMGAAVLATRACLRAGAGLATVHAPRCGYDVLQSTVPEAMFWADPDQEIWTTVPDPGPYTAIGIGPGIGTEPATAHALEQLLRQATRPLVLDADALNLLALNPAWWPLVPKRSILTPHPKEFERLFGKAADDFERNALHRRQAVAHGVYIVLKGANTAIAGPEGACWFNSTGNPGMATGGSGDVLTGLLTGLLAQEYDPGDACRLGVYLHGLAGDLASADWSQPGMISGDLVDFLGKAWLKMVKG